MTLKCPICQKPVSAGEEFFPFCSDRCRIIDLGNWASEKYVIPEPLKKDGETEDPDEE
jgi:hypothetical protein